MFAIYKKEMRSYFVNPIGYVFAGIFLAFSALLCCYTTLLSKSYDTSAYFMIMVFAFVVLIPLLTMRLFAEERKMRTEQLLLTAPVTLTGMVMGKFLAAMSLFLGCMAVSCINFIPLYAIASSEAGNLDSQVTYVGPVTAQVVGGMIGLILIGAAFIAIGTFISALTENQLAAAIITVAIILTMLVLNMVNSYIENEIIRAIINAVCFMSRFSNFSYGLLDPAALVYYASMAGVFLLLTVRVYDKRRWG
jgi:ABC-2 type transport system permease protein